MLSQRLIVLLAMTVVAGVASAAERKLPNLPFGITSFGAALVNQHVYVYGGHTGAAHSYSHDAESDGFLRLDLANPQRWETVGTVPRRAGLAMVSYGGKLYRIGGFEARNKKDEPSDLVSVRDFCRFDPATDRWEDLAPLPKGRSSHEAIVVGTQLIVVGGWELRGSQPTLWHDTALEANLASPHPVWKELPKPPFNRRAMALGAHYGKLYVLGGMQEQGGLTTTTYVLDMATGKWSPGPKLPGEGLEGFGGSALDCQCQLYATTYSGKLWRLSQDGRSWREEGQLPRPRFFQRMFCDGESSFIVLGGANMQQGKDLSVDIVRLNSSPLAAH